MPNNSPTRHDRCDARLEALLLEGLASGDKDLPLIKAFWHDLKTEATQIAQKQKPERPVNKP